MKKVLFISYYYPPAGGTSVQRALKFTKYLPQFGWEPVVLTARASDYALTDSSLLQAIPAGLRMFRTAAPDFYTLYGQVSGGLPDLSAIAVREKARESVTQRLGLWIRNLLFIPDARLGWLPSALRAASRILRSGDIDAVFTTSPPFTTALIGGLAASLHTIPWISDYRDPWTQAFFYFKRPYLSAKIEHAMESWLLRKANAVVSVNERILDALSEKYRWDRARGIAIPNGYDTDDFSGLKAVRGEHFTITYTGTMHTAMNPKDFISALAGAAAKNPEFKRRTRFKIFGRVSDDLLPMLKTPPLDEIIELTDHVPHDASLLQMLGSDLLLLLIPEFKGNEIIVTSKIFEYMRSGTPVLCLSTRGEAAEIILETKTGITVDGHDIPVMEKTLLNAFRRWKSGVPLFAMESDENAISRYDRRNTTGQLAGLLNKVCGE